MPFYWPYVAAFISPFLSAASAWALMRYTRSYAEGKEQRIAREKAEETWRQGRIDAEKALNDKINEVQKDRLEAKLTFEKDFAAITDILEESTEAHKLLAAIAADSKNHEKWLDRHDGDLDKLEQKLENMHNNILQLTRDHARNS